MRCQVPGVRCQLASDTVSFGVVTLTSKWMVMLRPRVHSHRDLIVWQRSMDLVDTIYDLVDCFPARERFGLSSQLTRAVVSVPANIAEGRARSTAKDFANFLVMARASLMETDTLLAVAVRRRDVPEERARPILDEIVAISKMLSTLRARITVRRNSA